MPYSDIGETKINLTNPEEARKMQEQTQVDWLAVSVGNIHRLATRKVSIQFPVLQQIYVTANVKKDSSLHKYVGLQIR